MEDEQERSAKVRAGTALRRAEVRATDAAAQAIRDAFKGTEQAALVLHGEDAEKETGCLIRRAARAAAEEVLHGGQRTATRRTARRPGTTPKPGATAGARTHGRENQRSGSSGRTGPPMPPPNGNAAAAGTAPATA